MLSRVDQVHMLFFISGLSRLLRAEIGFWRLAYATGHREEAAIHEQNIRKYLDRMHAAVAMIPEAFQIPKNEVMKNV